MTTYLADTDVADRPIRIHHGTPDDYNPVAPCKRYVERLRAAERDVQLIITDQPYLATCQLRSRVAVYVSCAPLPLMLSSTLDSDSVRDHAPTTPFYDPDPGASRPARSGGGHSERAHRSCPSAIRRRG
jgi:hypothetical protein